MGRPYHRREWQEWRIAVVVIMHALSQSQRKYTHCNAHIVEPDVNVNSSKTKGFRRTKGFQCNVLENCTHLVTMLQHAVGEAYM